MSRTHRPDPEHLSRFLDGDLDETETRGVEAHLDACPACRAELAALRELITRTGELPDRSPDHDVWPAIAARLDGPRRAAWLVPVLTFAAGVLVTLLLARGLGTGAGDERVADARFLLLLHQPQGADADLSPAEHAAIVERYRGWAQGLGAACVGGEELSGERWDLRGDGSAEPEPAPEELEEAEEIGGYFVLAARDSAEALRLARDCPHLDHGWIEVRPIR